MSDLLGILIVDDEIRSLEALRRILSEDFDVPCMVCTVH